MGERLKDKPQTTENRGSEDASVNLVDSAYRQMRQAGSDRTGAGRTSSTNFDNPYDHIAQAGLALRELESLKNIPAKDKVQIPDGQGGVREVTAEQRRMDLLRLAEAQFSLGMEAADRIDQNKVTQSVISLKAQIDKATDPAEKQNLQRMADVVDSMKHAPGVTRFAFACFLEEQGDFQRAKKMLDEASKKDVEAKFDPEFKKVQERVEAALKQNPSSSVASGSNPLEVLASAQDKRKAGDAAGAEAEYKRAIELAGKVDPKMVQENLQRIEQEKAANTSNPDKIKELDQQKTAWTAMAHAQGIAAVQYSDFLVEQKRYDEAKALLIKVGNADPDLVRGDKDYNDLLGRARNQGKAANAEPFDNPFVHLSNIEELAKKEDMAGVRRELEAAKAAADKIDRTMMQENKKVIDAQLKEEKDPEKRKQLEGMREAYDQMDHAAAFTRVCLARFEIANKNYNQAQALLAEAEKDQSLVNRPELNFAKLKEASIEPSTWDKIWGFTKNLLKELACDGVAILAGAGAVLLTGWSGPAALVAGGAAGAAAYTGMKALMGEEIHWYTPLWGAVDGVTGGTAALARTALTRVGGQIVTKEVAESMAMKTGVELTGLAAKEGTMAYGKAVAELGKEGLKQMAKAENLSLWTRMTSHVPMTGAVLGNAEYRAALNAVRGVTARNVVANVIVDGGTVGAGSLVFRGAHDGVDYANGKYTDFGDFLSNYTRHVVSDTSKGAGIGAIGGNFGYGTIASFGLNGGREALFGDNKTFGQWAGMTTYGTVQDMMMATPQTVLMHGPLGRAFSTFPGQTFMGNAAGAYTSAASLTFGDYYAMNGMADQPGMEGTRRMWVSALDLYMQKLEMEKKLAELQVQPTQEQLGENYFNMPGTNEMPKKKEGEE